MRQIDITGKKFGRLTALSSTTQRTSNGYIVWRCRCDCGAGITVPGTYLRNGHTKSCGCLSLETSAKNGRATRIHGESHKQPSREYRAWKSLRERCCNPKNPRFADYGGRGITVCERWESYENFLADIGRCPPGLSLDRIDNDKGYYKENCRWATPGAQANNRRRPRKRAAAITADLR